MQCCALTVAACLLTVQLLLAADTAPHSPLLPNPDFSQPAKDTTKPANWRLEGASTWATAADGSHFIHIVAQKPGQRCSVSPERPIAITPDMKALQVSIRYRTTGLQNGAQKWCTASSSFGFLDAVQIEAMPRPNPIIFSDQAREWTTVTAVLKVPDGATAFYLSSELHQVQAGSLDLAEINVTTLDAAAVKDTSPNPSDAQDPEAIAEIKSAAEVPTRRDGPRTILGYGNPTIWFISPYVDVMGHNFSQGLRRIVKGAKEKGCSIALGVAPRLADVKTQDESRTIYVFSYKNISYPLPANARTLVFVNTWLTPSVDWPANRQGKQDLVLIGDHTLGNDGDGKATDKERWKQIKKDDPALNLTILDSTGYYLPIPVWTTPILNLILDNFSHPRGSNPQP